MFREIIKSLKEIVVGYITNRLFPVTVLVFILFSVLVHRLFVLQIIEGDEHMDNFNYSSLKTLTIDSVRGNIYDRNGKLLAYNELSYSVLYSNDSNISNEALYRGISENELRNEILYRTICVIEDNGDELYVDFPIEYNGTEFRFTTSDTQLRNFLKNVYNKTNYDDLTDQQKNSTAKDIVYYLKDDIFEISDSYSEEYILKIASCRYKLWLNRYQQYRPVTIAYDVSETTSAIITEYADILYGMSISTDSLRRYNDAKYFSHIIGYIGTISSDELNSFNDDPSVEIDYTNEEMVGKTGIEQYCESTLRGTTGTEVMYVDNLGKVIEMVSKTPASAGDDVYLTIDADLQKYCYDTLEREIASIILSKLNTENTDEDEIPITIYDVYFGLFNNNYLSVEDMGNPGVTELESRIYSDFSSNKSSILSRLESVLTSEFIPVGQLDDEYQEYMEYICEMLSKNDILDSSLIAADSQEFIDYTSGNSSLEAYLKYAISLEAIDISTLEAESSYYNNDEIYDILCEYIINYLNLDADFDKLTIKYMIESGTISGSDVVNLIYIQNVLPEEGDTDYEAFLDSEFTAFEFMNRKIRQLEITPAMLGIEPCSGSVIVTDVNTGDILALVSYPSYDNNKLTNEIDADYYNTLLEDVTTPLYNRATMQKTAPGSTLKPLSAIAGLTENVITPGTYYTCTGIFETISPSPKCWSYPSSHGMLDVQGAIQESCNVYFYNMGYDMSKTTDGTYSDSYGIERYTKYLQMFNLDQLSGIELSETEPSIPTSDIVRTSIGQAGNSYTPIQLSRYVTALANNGTVYELTLIDKYADYEGNLIEDNTAEIDKQITEISDETWNNVHAGMRRVVSSLDSSLLINQIGIDIAGKSGTAQENENKANHGLYISYAPYDSPEVSVTCVLQNGYSSGNARELTSFIYAYMYNPAALADAEMSGNVIVSD